MQLRPAKRGGLTRLLKLWQDGLDPVRQQPKRTASRLIFRHVPERCQLSWCNRQIVIYCSCFMPPNIA